MEKRISFLFEDNLLLNELKKRIEYSGKFFLFLDYDGTLARIRKNPLSASLSKNKIMLLKKISRNKKIVMTIVKELLHINGYFSYFSSAEKPGYSGVAI